MKCDSHRRHFAGSREHASTAKDRRPRHPSCQLPSDTAVLGADGAIYFLPTTARRVLRLDPNTRETKLVGSDCGGAFFKWVGGVLAPDGCILCPPANATKVLCIDTRAQSTRLIGSDYAHAGSNKWVSECK